MIFTVRCPIWCPTTSININWKMAASSEPYRSDCAPGMQTIPCQAIIAPAALAVTYQLAVLKYKFVHSGLPTPSNHGMRLHSTYICHPAAGSTVHKDRLFHAYFSFFSTVCLELTAANIYDHWHSWECVNPALKLLWNIRLLLNTDQTWCQHCWSYDCMALKKFNYFSVLLLLLLLCGPPP